MSTELKKEIQDFMKEQDIIAPRLKAMDENIDKLAEKVKKYISRAWETSKHTAKLNICAMPGGSHCTNFTWNVLLDIPGHKIFGKNKWAKISYPSENNYEELCTDVKPPIDIKVFRSFAQQMENELGIFVQVYQKLLLTRKQIKKNAEKYGCHNFDSFNAMFDDDLELVKQGEVWHKGWDISDPFLICRKKSTQDWVVAYSSDGHSSDYHTVLIKPTEKELSDFFDVIEVDSDHLDVRELFGDKS